MTQNKQFDRLLKVDVDQKSSVLLLGPRGTGKTFWIKQHLTDVLLFDLLKTDVYNKFLANPSALEEAIPQSFKGWVVLDEVQKVPELLNEVHRLIETYHYRFILTGSSARSLRRKGVNLLAGRALNYTMHPLTCYELGEEFSLVNALRFGLLPSIYNVDDPKHYLETYITSYLREEVLQEGLARNLSEFSRFLQTASFSQGNVINFSAIAREASIPRTVVQSYFNIVEDLLIGFKLPVFTKRARRSVVQHPKFYFFDVGVFRTIRPTGPLDSDAEVDGPALETLFLQHLRAINDYYRLGYDFYFWRTRNNTEVDFVAYGNKGFFAFEIKRKRKIDRSDLTGLKAFSKDYPEAKLYLLYGGDHAEYHDNITALPFQDGLFKLTEILGC